LDSDEDPAKIMIRFFESDEVFYLGPIFEKPAKYTTNIVGSNPDIVLQMEKLMNEGWRNALPAGTPAG